MSVTPAPDRTNRGAVFVVVAIVAIAAALRLWNIGAGIPYNVAQDEPLIMERVARMMKTGDFNPHHFDWGSVTFYLNLIVSVGRFVLGAMKGAWSDLDQISADDLYLAGRQFTALVGAATVALTFAVGRRWGTGVGLFAAAFMAVMPLHVRESHYVLTDVPTTFFTTLTWLLALRAAERGTTRAIVAAGLTAGLATSTKYNGAMAIVFPMIAIMQLGGGWRLVGRRAGIVAGVALAGFLIGTPYAVLDLPKFLNDYARNAMIFAGEPRGEPVWSLYVKHFAYSVAQPATLAVAFGLMAVAWRGVTRKAERGRSLMLLSFVVLYFTVMARSGRIYARYLLPLLPLLCVACGVGVVSIVEWLRARVASPRVAAMAGAGLTVLVLAIPAVWAAQYGYRLAAISTVDQAYGWIERNVPRGSKFVVEKGAVKLSSKYPTVNVRLLVMRTIDDYRKDDVDYFLAGAPEFQGFLNDPAFDPSLREQYRALLATTKEVAAFDPSGDIEGPRLRVFRLAR